MKTFFFFLIPFLAFGQFKYYEVNKNIKVYEDKSLTNVIDSIYNTGVYTEMAVFPEAGSVYILYRTSKTGFIEIDFEFIEINKATYKYKEGLYSSLLNEKWNEKQKLNNEKRKAVVIDSMNLLIDKMKNIVPKNKFYIIHSESSTEYSLTNFTFSYFNNFTKKIKYLELDVQGYNRVGDPETQVKKLKLIGPIEAHSKNTHTFESVYYSNVIDKIKVKRIIVTLFDNTKYTFLPQDFTTKDRSFLENYVKYLYLELEHIEN